MKKGNVLSILFLMVMVSLPALAQQPQLPQSSVPQKQTVIKGDGPVWSLSISPDGKMLVAFFLVSYNGPYGWPGKVALWSFPDAQPLFAGLKWVPDSAMLSSSGIAITPDSKTLILGGGMYREGWGKPKWMIPLFSLPEVTLATKLESEHRFPLGLPSSDFARALVVTPDGNYFVVSYYKPGMSTSPGKVDLWSLRDKKLLTTLEGHSKEIDALAITPDGKTLVSGSRDKTIKLWSLPDGKLLSTLEGHTKAVRTLAITPDGKTFASGSDDKTIRLWSLTDGKLISSLEGHTEGINSIAITPDGKTLFSGSDDNTIKSWSLPEGKLLTTLQEHKKSVNALAVSPDGKLLVSGGSDRLIIFWSLTG